MGLSPFSPYKRRRCDGLESEDERQEGEVKRLGGGREELDKGAL